MSETPVTSVEHLPLGVVVRILANDLGEENINGLRQGVNDALAISPAVPFILDMKNVKYVPSLTLGALVGIINEFRARAQRLIFANFQPTVRQAISITRLDRIMEIVPDLPAALRSVGIEGESSAV